MAKIRKPRWDKRIYDIQLNRWLRYLAWKPCNIITLENLPN